MGLSDTDRTQGIYHHLNRITLISQELDTSKAYEDVILKIKNLCSELWHDFLGKTQNSAHWILGSSAGNKVTCEAESPWGIAVLYGIHNVCEKESIWDSMPFDVKNHLHISALLRYSENVNLSKVFEIYGHLESVIYNLRRYDDAYLKAHLSLSKTVSTLMGYCYALFTEEKETCAKAYLLHQISDMLLLFPYSKEMETEKEKMDVVSCLFNQLNLVWNYSGAVKINSKVSLKELCQIYKKLLSFQRNNTLSTPEGIECRVFSLLSICRKGMTKFRHDQILSILKEKKTPYNKKKLESLLLQKESSGNEEDEFAKRYQDAQNFSEDYMFEGLEEENE